MISSVEYGYDARGNRISMREATGGGVTWSYDRAQRLVNEFRSGASSYNTTYTYDATGNCLVKIKTGVRTTSTFDSANQLKTATDATGVTNYTFDANGNQQIIVSPGGNRTTYVWDYENQNTLVRLPSGARVTMAYNADQRRIRKDS